MDDEAFTLPKGDGWIETYSGLEFYLAEPTPAMCRLDDIAHGLSNCCRFAGQAREFYSVAEHSVYVSQMLFEKHGDARLAMCGLLHDAAEAYVGDMTRILKAMVPTFKAIEKRILEAVYQRFALTVSELDKERITWADNAMLVCEGAVMMRSRGNTWSIRHEDYVPPRVPEIAFLLPRSARRLFYDQFARISDMMATKVA